MVPKERVYLGKTQRMRRRFWGAKRRSPGVRGASSVVVCIKPIPSPWPRRSNVMLTAIPGYVLFGLSDGAILHGILTACDCVVPSAAAKIFTTLITAERARRGRLWHWHWRRNWR